MEVNPELDRRLVSFQADKSNPFYRWFKYKEAFSSDLVRYVIHTLQNGPGVLLDPFAGTGCALFAGRELGWNAVGIELLPVGFYAMTARDAAERVSVQDLTRQIQMLQDGTLNGYASSQDRIRHIRITRGAFPEDTERELAEWLGYCRSSIDNEPLRKLLSFAAFSVLEEISYTRKDGQYLRWDCRCPTRNIRSDFKKTEILGFRDALVAKLRVIAQDILSTKEVLPIYGDRPALDIEQGSCLHILPQKPEDSVDLVVTSPPYCNRYDYTRTYALELIFLGYNDEQVKDLRQSMLSCTVENKGKINELKTLYAELGRPDDFDRVMRTYRGNRALSEVLDSLEWHRRKGNLNNPNIIRMIKNYFFESCFVIFELARLLKRGGHIVMVNDNVRYAGEKVPVDLILSDFAETFGLSTKHIWMLARGKGNSSQQMGDHGRSELRKCVYVWQNN